MRRHLLLFIALCLAMAARGQTALDSLDLSWLPQPTQAKALHYWFDDDANSVQTLSAGGTYSLDASTLIDGLHTLHCQVVDDSGNMAYASSSVFLKMGNIESATAAKSLRYWFDDDANSLKTLPAGGTYSLDVSSLIDGLHTLHCQVVDDSGRMAYASSSVFLKMGNIESATAAKSLRYWFDDDTNSLQTLPAGGTYSLNASTLIDGLHTLHCQVVDDSGRMAYTSSSVFLKMGSFSGGETVKPSKLMYWFDDETAIQNVDVSEGTQMLDASGLIEGLHTIHYQVLCNNGQMTPAMSSIFLRMNFDTETAVAKSLLYWFDDEQTATEVEITDGVQLLDASNLIEGLHTVHYQIANSNGTLGAPYSSVFLKMDGDIASTSAKSIRYWFDDDATTVKITDVANGTQTLDVSELLAGLHTLNYQLIDSNGKVGVPVTRLFMKNFDMVLADGQNRVTKYQYWLNRNSQDIQSVSLDDATNPYTLIALLPMQKEPLQTSQFHFELTDGVPTIYAKNTFHIRFHDAQGYFTDGDKPFIDYSVSQIVEPVGELQATQTFDKVADNNIRWYTIQAAPGDTAAFKLSQPATVQVFAPSGAEVFKTSESASVKWSGIHTWEDGTYYLAVHDVTGSQSTMKLEYMHMDKYDVVDWDVHTVGNGGCSTITFKGNGFRDLYAVDLVIAPGDTIHSVDVSHDSDAETAVTFDFTDATLGEYNAVFHFTEEDKPIANVVTVEEAIDIELATDVSFPSSFLRGTSTTYTIKITNKGNMTAYNVPIYIYVSSKNANDITNLSLKGLELQSLYDFMNTEYWTEEERQEMKEFSDKIGNEHYFYKMMLYDSDLQDSVIVRKAFLFVSVSPKDTKQFTLTLHSHQKVNAYFTIPTEWNSLTDKETTGEALTRRKQIGEKYCCYHDGFECALNSFAYTMSWVSIGGLITGQGGVSVGAELVGCISSGISTLSNIGATFACDRDRKLLGDKLRFGKLLSWAGTAGGCLTGAMKTAKEVQTALSFGINQVQMPFSLADCTQAGKNPNCPPGPQGGGSSTPQPPVDPNDIFGYLSEAGSKFIADSVANVMYTIEFENDTTFATAAAHTIVIKDTLDSRYFDLTKFMPTGIRIGEHEAFLNEDDVVTTNDKTFFVKTIDMRPEINAIAQVDGTFSHTTGIAEWRFTSLDPMTMEPTDDLMQGILPVNYNGTSGIGEVLFEIGMKQSKADGTEIKNRADIVFDYEEAILTPTWTNIVDAAAPSSIIDNSWMVNDSTLRITADGFDARSGVWKYTWYVQAGENAPWWKEGETDSCSFDYHIYEGIDYGFCVLATDSAGNVEQKVIQRERSFKTYGPDYEDGISPFPTSPEEEEPIYDLSGRQIGNGKSSNGNSPKGVIIRNRKKTLVTE